MFKNLDTNQISQWASAILVVLISGLAGQFAAHGMNPVQWLGAAVAVLGSITLAVLLRVWPPQPARVKRN